MLRSPKRKCLPVQHHVAHAVLTAAAFGELVETDLVAIDGGILHVLRVGAGFGEIALAVATEGHFQISALGQYAATDRGADHRKAT